MDTIPSTKGRRFRLSADPAALPLEGLTRYDERFDYALQGHFYLAGSGSFKPEINLKRFFDLAAEDPAAALREVAGGAFALIYRDRVKNELCLACDRDGLQPIYYEWDNGRLEAAFHLDDWRDRELDPVAALEFLEYGCLLFSESAVSSVRRSPAAALLRLTADGTLTRDVYHERRPARPDGCDLGESIERLDQAFSAFFARSDSEAGCILGLSGGYDSRLILGYLVRQGVEPCRAITMGHPSSNEARLARRSARALGLETMLRQVPSDLLNRERYAIADIFHLIAALDLAHVGFLSRLVAEAVEDLPGAVFHDGYLGDVVMGGSYFSIMPRRPRAALNWIVKGGHGLTPLRDLEHYVDLSLAESQFEPDPTLAALPWRAEARAELRRRIEKQLEGIHARARSHEEMRHEGRLAQRGYRYIINGPRSLSAVLATFLPFMDRKVRGVLDSLPLKELAHHSFYDRFLVAKLPELAGIPTAYGGGATPASHGLPRRLLPYLAAIDGKIRSGAHRLSGGRIDLRQAYASLDRYLADPGTRVWLAEELEHVAPELLPLGLNARTLRPRIFLRLLTLLRFFRLRAPTS